MAKFASMLIDQNLSKFHHKSKGLTVCHIYEVTSSKKPRSTFSISYFTNFQDKFIAIFNEDMFWGKIRTVVLLWLVCGCKWMCWLLHVALVQLTFMVLYFERKASVIVPPRGCFSFSWYCKVFRCLTRGYISHSFFLKSSHLF